MSPPDVDPKKQERQHRPALRILLYGVVFVVVAGIIYAQLVDDPSLDGPVETSPITSEPAIGDNTGSGY